MRGLLIVKKVTLFFLIILFTLITTKMFWVAIFRVHADALIHNQASRDLFARRAFLIEKIITNKAGLDDMPKVLPELFQREWSFGTHTMSAAGLTNLSFLYPETRLESIAVIENIISKLLSNEFREFDTKMWNEDALATLNSSNGHIAYLGQLNFVLAQYRLLGGDNRHDELFNRISVALIHKLSQSPVWVAETYPNEIYITDIVVAVASIKIYEDLFENQKYDFSSKWIKEAKQNLIDPVTGLLVFSVDKKGRVYQSTRGTGAGWNSFYLSYLDSQFSKEQFDLMKKCLKEKPLLGVTGISEWPNGMKGRGDLDSGPLILGLSPSGTGFAVGGARFHEDEEFLDSLLLTSEIAGFSVQHSGKRSYLLSPLVGDAIMLAMKSATPWDNRFLGNK